MKRIVILMTLLAMVLGAGFATAADLMATGSWRVTASWGSDLDMEDDGDGDAGLGQEEFSVWQRLRTSFHFIANENLKAVLQIEFGTEDWGDGAFQIGGDAVGIEVKSAYVEFVWPNTNVTFMAGLMPLALPGSGFGSPILSTDVTAAVMSTPLTDSVSLLAGWARAFDVDTNGTSDTTQDTLDAIFLALPLDFDGVALTPYLAYGYAGDNFLSELLADAGSAAAFEATIPGLLAPGAGAGKGNDVDVWYAGLVLNLSLFDPLNIAAAFHYGDMDADDDDTDRTGWVADLAVEYTGWDFVTPELFFAYSTGEDSDVTDGSERIPAIASGYGPESVWFTGFNTGDGYDGYDTDRKFGFWTAGLALKNISFLENLTHMLQVLYIAGTNDDGLPGVGGFGEAYTQTLTEDDSIWEFDFMSQYQVYDELALRLTLAYLAVDMESDNWAELASDGDDADVFLFQLGLRYDF